jgi:diguanylate cyclase (GGDEF)-like protein
MASDLVPTHSLLTPQHILLIESNTTDVGILREQIIAAIGPQINIAHTPSVDDALERLHDQQFDTILLNLSADAAESVKRLLEHTNVPIIGLTSRADDSVGLQALAAGAEDYLVKPALNSDTLRHGIQCAIARSTWKNQLLNLSFVDDLTGLYNRRGFMTLGEQQLNIARRARSGVSLAFADLDALKSINDNFGHGEGDRALKNVATILKNTFQRGSDLIARIGGDEFAVLWIANASFSIETVQTRLKTALDSFIAFENLPYPLLVSVGFCQYHPDFSNPLTEMLSEGDQRMYEQKRRSKPNVA